MAVLQVNEVTVREHGNIVIKDLSFSIDNREQLAIVGPSGSGKTSLLHALSRKNFSGGTLVLNDGNNALQRIVLVEQQHHFKNLSNTSNFYYQQRFNSSDSEDAITVKQALQENIKSSADNDDFSPEVEHILDLLRLRTLLEAKLIQLSNGENKRLQIAKALLLHPAILMLDSPFTGLDVDARRVLVELLTDIIQKGIHIILVTSPHHLPDFITHVLSLEKNGEYAMQPVEVYRKNIVSTGPPTAFLADEDLLNELLSASQSQSFDYAIKMNQVKVEYNDRRILDDINWEVRNGECWSLSGPNGSGKSTLLSLVNADNPQVYANDIYLFDRKRGSGETIWEIKKKIGFVSPELHLYFDASINCFDVVSSGLFDTIGLFRMLNILQEALVGKWMKLLKIEHTRYKLLSQLSNSEQRLVLLARALVKNPPMLILDEPCQGLDENQVARFKGMVDEICRRTGKTLIYVSHYPQEIPLCVNKFIRLENGKMVVTA